MARITKHLLTTLAAALILAACSSDAEPNEVAAVESTTTVAEETVSDVPESIDDAASADDAPTTEPTVPVDPDEEDDDDGDEDDGEEDAILCTAPAAAVRYVDVPLDDPDGGLNWRLEPGVESSVIGVFPRSSEVVSTGECQTIGSTDWWQVVPNVSEGEDGIGWVSSSFLSADLVFNPGIGKAIEDTDNVGVGGETLDEMITKIAEAYGFDEDLVITMIGEPVGADAIGGSVTYELTGLKDDASNGYRVEVDFIFDKNEDEGGEIESYTAARITNYALCSRGVTDDGLCT